MESHEHDPLSRRAALAVGALTGSAAPLLAACGGGEATTSPSSTATSTSTGGALAKVADIPVGGAISATTAEGDPIIISQPTTGEVVAFSAICTHKGCTVAPATAQIVCPCHGSTYDLATGDNTGGPAPSPLAKVGVTVQDGEVLEA